jgi:hypothetical protein
MTNSAFISFNTNGFWVGKFETGYDGATSTASAQVNSSDSSKIIIKPNVYSWRNITVGNAFKASLEYLESDNSHMMKNTEWGAVAYLQHSQYGSATSVRTNNNRNYITGYSATEEPTLGYNNGASIEGNRNEATSLGKDGTYTVNYLNSLSSVSSTTGNKSGIYDMSGGAWEYTMGYTTGATTVGGSSGITSLYFDFFTNSSWDKYYDKYSSTVNTQYNNRILGDSTAETFNWYRDYADFVYSGRPWFYRSGHFDHGFVAGTFAFGNYVGFADYHISFRLVLAPTK